MQVTQGRDGDPVGDAGGPSPEAAARPVSPRRPDGTSRAHQLVVGRFALREALPRDARGVAELHARAALEASRRAAVPATLEPPSVDERESRWSEHLALPPGDDHFVLVAEAPSSGEVAGFVAGGGSRDPDGKGDGEVYALFVDPGRWGHGIGRLLLEGAVAALADASFASATIWVPEADTEARCFCTALGWMQDGHRRPTTSGVSGRSETRYRLRL